MSYINVQNIYKSFGNLDVLKDVSFSIEKGECFGLIGPNGAGKSTLIDIICGLQKANSGDVVVDGQSIKNQAIAIRQKLGVVPQDLALVEELNAYDNLVYFGTLYGLTGKVLKQRVEELLQVIGLVDKKRAKVKTFSGGMKRRLNIAAALLHRPEFIILDEPTVGVDPQSRQHIFDFLLQLKEEGTTILYTSHYMEEIEALCDRLYVLDLGEEVAYGTKAQVKSLVSQSNRVYLMLDTVPSDLAERLEASDNGIVSVEARIGQLVLVVDNTVFSTMKLLKLLEQSDVVVKSLSVEDLSLEETFIRLTGKALRD